MSIGTREGIINSMRRKIPVLPLLLQFIIVRNVYQDDDDIKLKRTIFWCYYPLLCLICFIYELAYAYNIYTKYYDTHSFVNRLYFSMLSSFISLWAFVSTSYYVQDGKPFSLLFNYNSLVANVIFYMSFGLISLITYLEHFKWPHLPYYQLSNTFEESTD